MIFPLINFVGSSIDALRLCFDNRRGMRPSRQPPNEPHPHLHTLANPAARVNMRSTAASKS